LENSGLLVDFKGHEMLPKDTRLIRRRPAMRKAFALSVAIILALLLTAPATYAKFLILNNGPTQMYFSPNGGCTEAIVKEKTNANIFART
jgi:hypothetical protein